MTIPLFVLVLIAVGVCLWSKAVKGWSVALGVLLGLTAASTSFGPPILAGVTAASEGIVSAVSAIGGA